MRHSMPHKTWRVVQSVCRLLRFWVPRELKHKLDHGNSLLTSDHEDDFELQNDHHLMFTKVKLSVFQAKMDRTIRIAMPLFQTVEVKNGISSRIGSSNICNKPHVHIPGLIVLITAIRLFWTDTMVTKDILLDIYQKYRVDRRIRQQLTLDKSVIAWYDDRLRCVIYSLFLSNSISLVVTTPYFRSIWMNCRFLLCFIRT